MDLFPVGSKSSSKLQIYYLCCVQNTFFLPHISFFLNQMVLRVYGILHYSHLPSYILCSSMSLNVKGHLFALFKRRGRAENTCISKIAVIYFITSRLKYQPIIREVIHHTLSAACYGVPLAQHI